MTQDSICRYTSQHPPTAAGSVAARQLPSGMTNLTGRKVPPLTGVFGSSHDFTMTNTPPWVTGRPEFMGPTTCGAVPAKSRVIESPWIASFPLMGRGSGDRPPLSMYCS